MKNSGQCPKCGGTDVVRCKTAANGAHDRIPVGLFGQAGMERWVCCSCGYCELWVDEASLEEVRAFWERPAEK